MQGFRKDQAMYVRVKFPSVDIERLLRRVKFERKVSHCGFEARLGGRNSLL